MGIARSRSNLGSGKTWTIREVPIPRAPARLSRHGLTTSSRDQETLAREDPGNLNLRRSVSAPPANPTSPFRAATEKRLTGNGRRKPTKTVERVNRLSLGLQSVSLLRSVCMCVHRGKKPLRRVQHPVFRGPNCRDSFGDLGSTTARLADLLARCVLAAPFLLCAGLAEAQPYQFYHGCVMTRACVSVPAAVYRGH